MDGLVVREIVTLAGRAERARVAMTHGPIPAPDIAAALSAYNAATARYCQALPCVTWEELMNWAEIHHILTSKYAADGRYPYRWDKARPAAWPGRDRTWP